MRKSETKPIDGVTFTVTQMPAMRSMKLLHKLLRAAGPAMLRAASSGGQLSDLSTASLADAAEMLFEKFTSDDLEALIRELCETTTVEADGKTMLLMPAFDHVMTGRPLTVLKLLKFALEVNYADFFAAGLAAGDLAGLLSNSKESTTSVKPGPVNA